MGKFVRSMFVLWFINLIGLLITAIALFFCKVTPVPSYLDIWFNYTLLIPITLGLIVMVYYIKDIYRGIVEFING